MYFSSKKRKNQKHFGLARKLDRLLRQRQSDLVLQEHVANKNTGIHLVIKDILEENIFGKVFLCHNLDNMSDKVRVWVMTKEVKDVKVWNVNTEIYIRQPFRRLAYPDLDLISGVSKVEILDQPIRKSENGVKALANWSCNCRPI